MQYHSQPLYSREFHLVYECEGGDDRFETMRAQAVTDGLCQFQSPVLAKSLEHVSIVNCRDMEVAIPILRRLVSSREEGRISPFCWDVGKPAFTQWGDPEPWTQQVFDILKPTLPYLTSLEIHTTFAAEGPDLEKDLGLAHMIKRECISLRRLSICEGKTSKRFPRCIRDVLEAAPMKFEFRRHARMHLATHFINRDNAWVDDSHDM
jgi:hypothetical protein